MARGIIFIEKLYAGELWENSYPFRTSAVGASILNESDLVAIGADLPLTADNTNSSSANFNAQPVKLLRAIVAFERGIHAGPVVITKAYVSDGSKNSAITDVGPLHSTFATKPIAMQGLSSSIDPNGILAGNTVLKIGKVPAGFSQKASANSYRCVMSVGEVYANGRRLVGWHTPQLQADRTNIVQGEIAASHLSDFYGAGTDGVFFGIGKHAATGAALGLVDKGDLIDVSPISGLIVIGPFSRQVPRGKRRAAVAP